METRSSNLSDTCRRKVNMDKYLDFSDKISDPEAQDDLADIDDLDENFHMTITPLEKSKPM